MDKMEKLKSLKWKSFERYPVQLTSIYLHSVGEDAKGEEIHKFLRIECFNAMTFNVEKLEEKLGKGIKWTHYWLPTSIVEELL